MMNNEAQRFFINKIKNDTDIDSCYFSMPSNDSFTYFINELRVALINRIEEKINNNYVLELSKWFYAFLEKDDILRSVDSLKYSYLLLLIKEISEGKNIDEKETLTILTELRDSISYLYFKRIVEEIISICNQENPTYDLLRNVTNLFINECLAKRIDIRFIKKTTDWFEKGVFESFDNYLNFFLINPTVSYDIYIPIEGYMDENSDVFERNKQEILKKDGIHYLHIYQNDSIDYYNVITSNMVRIDSIFNILKLFTLSKIDYKYDDNIIVNIRSRMLNIAEELIEFDTIVKYKGVSPFSKFMLNNISNLSILYNDDKDLYHKILNIIGYAEKDNDLISTSSYVDAWIALESLYSLDGIMSGFSSVKRYLPSFLSSRIILNKITYTLIKCFGNKNKIKAERFFEMTKEEIEQKLKFSKCELFYKHELLYLHEKTSNCIELKQLYESVEKRLSIDVLRIYMLRNEYVHKSKLSAFRSLQFYKLKNYLTISIDIFFNMLNQRIKIDKNRQKLGLEYEVFSKIKEKNKYREVLFKICTEKWRYLSNKKSLNIDELRESIEWKDVVTNIILNNNNIVKKFVKFDE